jgi:hypothetical protein
LCQIEVGEGEGVESGTPFGNLISFSGMIGNEMMGSRYLEPVGAASVPASDSARSLAEIDGGRPLVVQSVVKLKTDSTSGGDRNGLRCSSGSDITGDIA